MVMIMVIRPASIAVVLLTFSHYISDPILKAYCITDTDITEKVQITLAISGLGEYICFCSIVKKIRVHFKVTDNCQLLRTSTCGYIS